MALELSTKLPKPNDVHHLVEISREMFKPFVFAVDWFDTWEQVMGVPPLSWRHDIFMDMFVLPGSWLNFLMVEFCAHYPRYDLDGHQPSLGSVEGWTQQDNEKYLHGIQKLWTRWMSDNHERQNCLQLIAPHIDPKVFDLVLAPILSSEDMSFMLAQNISDEVRSLPNTQRYVLSVALAGAGQQSQSRRI